MTPGRYWDANIFLAWLKKDPNNFPLCQAVVDECEAGRCRIITSSLTIVEVHKLRKKQRPTPEEATTIQDFFMHSYIVPIELDRHTAELARKLVWDFEALQSWDAVHVASAMRARAKRLIERFDSFDQYLQGLSGKLDGDLIIGEPNIPPNLPFEPNQP